MRGRRYTVAIVAMSAVTIILAAACLICGPVDIPAGDVLSALTGHGASKTTWTNIILELRLPMTVTAAVSGIALSVAGLLMQTAFDNPLAGPSIMGVSTGSSLGVALAVMVLGGGTAAALAGAAAGAAAVILVLVALSMAVRSTMMVLIGGIMISYLSSSAITITNYMATADSLHTFVVWGLGSFAGVDRATLPLYCTLCLIPAIASLIMIKPLDALLLSDRYATNLGVNVVTSRTLLLIIAGALTATVTAWCGPIAFIGLAVPHMARLALGSSSHGTLLPMTAVTGAAASLLALWLSVIPADWGQLPVNAITPIIGVPVIIYIIINRRRLAYFN